MAYPVKKFLSTDVGSPSVSGTAGSMAALLDACLKDGFNLGACSALVVVGGVATATRSGHGFTVGQIILIAGVTNLTGLNGEAKLTAVTTNTFSWAVTGVADGTATGTISSKVAPVGWEKTFSGTNKGVYRSTDITGTRLYLRVDDSNAQYALVVGYETMSDVDTGSGLFPTAVQVAGGLAWRKSDISSTATRRWMVVADGRTVYMFVEWALSSYSGQFSGYAFGDVATWKAGDGYQCIIIGHTTVSPSAPGLNNDFGSLGGTQGKYLARSYTGLGSAIGFLQGGLSIQYMGYTGSVYPNGSNNAFVGNSIIPVYEGGLSGHIRGLMRGLVQPIQSVPLSHGDTAYLTNLGRTVVIIGLGVSSSVGRAAIDIDGPWS